MSEQLDTLRAAQRDLVRIARDLRELCPDAVLQLTSAYREIDKTIREDYTDHGTPA